MDAALWSYLYLKGLAFGLVCAMILAIPWAASLEPGEGIPGRYFWYVGLLAIAGYIGGLVWLT